MPLKPTGELCFPPAHFFLLLLLLFHVNFYPASIDSSYREKWKLFTFLQCIIFFFFFYTLGETDFFNLKPGIVLLKLDMFSQFLVCNIRVDPALIKQGLQCIFYVQSAVFYFHNNYSLMNLLTLSIAQDKFHREFHCIPHVFRRSQVQIQTLPWLSMVRSPKEQN